MSTFQIISSQISFVNKNINVYFYILIVPVILTLVGLFFSSYADMSIGNASIAIFIFIIAIYYSYKAVVNIHRVIILGETPDNLNLNVKITLTYFCYSLLIIAVATMPLIVSILLPFLSGLSNFYILFAVIGGVLSFVWVFIAFMFFSLNLPLVAIGKKISFFKMWSLSKGFRLTLFFQLLLIVTIPNSLINVLGEFFQNTFFYMLLYVLEYYLFAIYISCLSKTHLLWSEKQNLNY